jgi:hypothetical protein
VLSDGKGRWEPAFDLTAVALGAQAVGVVALLLVRSILVRGRRGHCERKGPSTLDTNPDAGNALSMAVSILSVRKHSPASPGTGTDSAGADTNAASAPLGSQASSAVLAIKDQLALGIGGWRSG